MPDVINDRALVEEEKDVQSSGDDKDTAPDPQAGTTQPQRRQRPKMLPEITPELLQEHEAQLRASAGAAHGGHGVSNGTNIGSETCCHYICPCHHEDENGEPAAICGIPYYLFMILAALVAAVTAGTVLAVVYYDPKAPASPTLPPTMPPTSSIVFQSTEPTSP